MLFPDIKNWFFFFFFFAHYLSVLPHIGYIDITELYSQWTCRSVLSFIYIIPANVHPCTVPAARNTEPPSFLVFLSGHIYQVTLFGQVTYLINVLHPRPCSTSPHFFLARVLSHPMTTPTLVTSCPLAPPALGYQRDLPTAHPLSVCLVFRRQHDTPTPEEYFHTDLKECLRGVGVVARHFSQGSNPETSWDWSYPASKCLPWIFKVIEAHQAEVDGPEQVPVMRRHDPGPWETAPSAQQLVQ